MLPIATHEQKYCSEEISNISQNNGWLHFYFGGYSIETRFKPANQNLIFSWESLDTAKYCPKYGKLLLRYEAWN